MYSFGLLLATGGQEGALFASFLHRSGYSVQLLVFT